MNQSKKKWIESYKNLVLSDKDRELFLYLIENPPQPNQALKSAMRKFKEEDED